MATTLWFKDGKLIFTKDGKLVFCDHCPCVAPGELRSADAQVQLDKLPECGVAQAASRKRVEPQAEELAQQTAASPTANAATKPAKPRRRCC